MTYEDVKKAIGPPPFGDKNLVEYMDLPSAKPLQTEHTPTQHFRVLHLASSI